MPDQLRWGTDLIIRAMAAGVDVPLYDRWARAGLKVIPPGTPLTLNLAARAIGVSVRRALRASQTPEFRDMLGAEMKAARMLEQAANLKTAIAIRDNPKDGSARADSVRLAAISRIREAGAPVEARLPFHPQYPGRYSRMRRLGVMPRMLGVRQPRKKH